MVVLPEEPITSSPTDLSMRDSQALTPDMILNEPEYWNRYEIEIGEEGEGSQVQIHSNGGGYFNGASPVWPHFDAYISPIVENTNFLSIGQARSTERLGDTPEGDESQVPNNEELVDLNTHIHGFNTPLSEILRQWNTQSTIGDVLRDFHVIIAYVLEGMQRYEEGMTPWPRVSPSFDQGTRNLCQEDTEGNISITSASRRVLSLLESTGIPGTPRNENPAPEGAARRISKIPRLIRKDKVEEVETASEDVITGDQEIAGHIISCHDPKITSKVTDGEKTKSPRKVASLTTPGEKENLPTKEIWVSKNPGESRKANYSRSPEKTGDPSLRAMEHGSITSKIPILLARPGGHTQSLNTEKLGRSPAHKGVENSPIGGQRERLMAGEMQVPLDLHFMRSRKLTRDFSPMTKSPILGVISPKKDNAFSEAEEDETDNELNEKQKKKRSRFN